MARAIKAENIVAAGFLVFAFTLPLFKGAYSVSMFAHYYIVAILALSMSLVWGYCGVFSFGAAAFYGVGAYAYAILSLSAGETALTPLYMLVAVLISTLLAAVIGYFMFYGGINDVFVALITLCVSLVLETFMAQTAGSQWSIAGVQLGGYNGINGIPTIHFGNQAITGIPFYYFVLFILLAVYIVLRMIKHRKAGYTLIAIRENRARSLLFGYNIEFIQMIVFALGGTVAGMAGVLYTAWGGYITPNSMGLIQATIPVVIVAAGGRKNMTAALVFAVIYAWFTQTLSATGSEYGNIIVGVSLIIAILFVPNGFIVAVFDWIDKFIGWATGKKKG
ncbi:MAG TPA: urea ABC transporter permease [Clostridiales bacterium]|jgi:branched-chain amino acid transport system permease protein|nr:urea ABC transporter permease [Clostridiales bacterium]